MSQTIATWLFAPSPSPSSSGRRPRPPRPLTHAAARAPPPHSHHAHPSRVLAPRDARPTHDASHPALHGRTASPSIRRGVRVVPAATPRGGEDREGGSTGGGGGSDDGGGASSPPWWASLREVHVLVFHPDTAREAIFTTSRRGEDFAANDFVAFEDVQDALRAAVKVSEATDDMPVVDSVDPRVVVFLAEQCGYGVEVTPKGAAFEPPAVVIDEASSSSDPPGDDLAVSAASLQRYLVSAGGSEEAGGGVDDEDEENIVRRASDDAAEEAAARKRAAGAMREALRHPLDTVKAALRAPAGRLQGSVRAAAQIPRGREALDALWGEEVPMPLAASAVFRALIVIAERRLSEGEAENLKGEDADEGQE